MKKFLSVLVCLFFIVFSVSLSACATENEKVNIKYLDASTIMQLLISDNLECGLLPEPVLSKLKNKLGKDFEWSVLSLQSEYDSKTCSYPQAILMVKESVLNDHPSILENLEENFNDNLEWTKNNINLAVESIAKLYPSTSLNPSQVLDRESIDNCNIKYNSVYGEEREIERQRVREYIDNLLSVNIGLGIAPAKKIDDDFFYDKASNESENEINTKFSFYIPDGAPSLAFSKNIFDSLAMDYSGYFDFKVVNSNDITSYITGANDGGIRADFIVLPVNAGSKLYNGQVKYKMVASITNGNLFIVSKGKNKIESIKDLKDKTIGVTGEGLVPDITLKYLLSKNKLSVKNEV